jgi:photosystem II stability/assembly factor-like uncharacterized protein
MVGDRENGQPGGQVFYTNNAGAYAEFQTFTEFPLNTVFFIDRNAGWAGGENGLILRTGDGGQNWTDGNIGSENNIYDMQFFNDSTGRSVTANGGIYRTDDGGNTWQPDSSGTNSDLLSMHFTDADHGWVCGAQNTILIKSTGGNDNPQWIPVSIVNLSPNITWKDIFFVDSLHGWVIGDFHSVYKTLDGGLTWESETIETTKDINAIYMLSPTSGWIVGDEGTIFTYTPLED